MKINRRAFIKKGGMSLAAPWVVSPFNFDQSYSQTSALDIHLFSKHLQFLRIEDAAEKAVQLGFDGLDLTVRPKGHVLPESAARDLPIAIKAMKNAGAKCSMITTAISDHRNETDSNIIETAAKHGVGYYRCDWFQYIKGKTMPESIAHFQEKINALGKLNQKHNIIGCYQNHAGKKIGASYWEIKQLLKTVNIAFFGTQYDIRHAVVEGGLSWENGLQLLHPHIKTIVLKDFRWEKINHQWKVVNVPIGEGIVDFKTYFKLLKHYGLSPPVSLHLEYPLGGAEKGKKEITAPKQLIYDAMKKDLKTVKQFWKEA